MQLTDNEMNIMKRLEDRFRTAVFGDYARNVISSDLDSLLSIYRKVFGSEYRLNKTCSSCQLAFLKQIGRWWLSYKEEQEKVSEAPEPILNIKELEEPVTNTNKSTSTNTKNKTGQKKQPKPNGKKA